MRLFLLLSLVMNIIILPIPLNNNSYSQKPFIKYKDAVLIEADGIGVVDIVYIPIEYIEHNTKTIPYYNKHAKDLRILTLKEINTTIINILNLHAPKNKSANITYGALKVYLKNGRVFYVIMDTYNSNKIIRKGADNYVGI